MGNATSARVGPRGVWVQRSPRSVAAPRGVRARTAIAFLCWGPRRVAVGVCGPRATDDPPDLQADVFTLRDLDVCLVLAVTPFVLIGGMPTLGYLVEAGALA